MLELASSFGLPLLEGYESSEAFYVPIVYEQVCVFAPLPDKIYRHVRYRAHSTADMPVFDVLIYDEGERPLIDIQGFQLRQVQSAGLVASATKPTAIAPAKERSLLELSLTEGILPEEGAAVFKRIINADSPAQIIASSLDLRLLRQQQAAQVQAAEQQSAGGGFKLARPEELQSEYAAPRSHVEKTVVTIWESLLGITHIGIEDDFFDLGGHSLLAIRSISHIRKELGIELSLREIFNFPTIAELAQQIEVMLWTQNEDEKVGEAAEDEEEFIL